MAKQEKRKNCDSHAHEAEDIATLRNDNLFSALVLYVVARGAAATKYAILISLGNIPVSYMTAFDGFAHDRWSAGGMLTAEALLGVSCVALGLLALWRIRC